MMIDDHNKLTVGLLRLRHDDFANAFVCVLVLPTRLLVENDDVACTSGVRHCCNAPVECAVAYETLPHSAADEVRESDQRCGRVELLQAVKIVATPTLIEHSFEPPPMAHTNRLKVICLVELTDIILRTKVV